MELTDQEATEMDEMDNREIAEHIAKMCYMSKGDTDNLQHVNLKQLMAVQLLMERVMLPPGTNSYTEEEMADEVEDYMDYMADSMAEEAGNNDEKELEDIDLAALNP